MYYGWFVVSAALLAQVAVVGFFTYVFSLLVLPLQVSFEASRSEVMYSMSLTAMLGLFLAPVIGVMADKYPIRWLMVSGAVIFGGGSYFWRRPIRLINNSIAASIYPFIWHSDGPKQLVIRPIVRVGDNFPLVYRESR